MRLHRIESSEVSLEIDLDTGVVTEIIDKRTGSRHIFSRRPELETRRPGMGVYVLEPFFCREPEAFIDRDYTEFRCLEKGLSLYWRVSLEGARVGYRVVVENRGPGPLETRARILIYSGCGRGGYWGDPGVEGASYSCRYYVYYGSETSRETFSSLMIPSTTRGFRFDKHSYESRVFPETRWVATIDRVLETGLLVRCLSRDCLVAVEDQFFDIEVSVFSPRTVLGPGGVLSLDIEMIPLRGLRRVDYVSDELVAAVESPSIALPGQRYRGELVVYTLRDISCDVDGYIEYDKNMASIGKRGYCIDQVRSGKRRSGLSIEKRHIDAAGLSVWRTGFESVEEIEFRMERELYEIPDIVIRLCGDRHVVRRTFSIQPEALEVLRRVPESLRRAVYERYIYENRDVERGYYEAPSLVEAYVLAARAPRLRKFTRYRAGDVVLPEKLVRIVMDYLSRRGFWGLVERVARDPGDKILLFNIGQLDIVLAYMATRDRAYTDLLNRVYEKLIEYFYREDLVGYYTAIHGGAGASRFVEWVLALDLVDDLVREDMREHIAYMLHEIGREMLRITNVWAGNWEFAEAAGLLAIAEKVDSLYSSLYREKALTVLTTLQYTFLRDGGSVELAAGYHHYDLESIVRGAEVLYYSGSREVYDYRLGGDPEPLIKRALEWLWGIATPYNTAPALEDTNEFYIPPDLYVIAYTRYRDPVMGYIGRRLWATRPYLTNPLAVLALVLEGGDFLERDFGEYRRERVSNYIYSGRLVYRESEDPGALYIVVDYGPHGGWHGHPDKLSFEVYRRGEAVVVDAGSAGYYNPVHWTWSRKTYAHNTVSRGDEDHIETRGELLEYSVDGGLLRAVLRSRIYDDVEMTRELVVSGEGDVREILVRDTVRGSGEFMWNLHVRGECRGGGHMVSCETSRNRLEILSLDGAEWALGRGLRGDSERTWHIYKKRSVEDTGVFETRILLI